MEESPASNRITIGSDAVKPRRRPSGPQGHISDERRAIVAKRGFIVARKARYYKDNNANNQYRINQRDIVQSRLRRRAAPHSKFR
jgi:hypothetical protein